MNLATDKFLHHMQMQTRGSLCGDDYLLREDIIIISPTAKMRCRFPGMQNRV